LYYFLQVIKYLSYSRYLPPQENRRVSKEWGAIDAKVDLVTAEVYYSDSDPEEDLEADPEGGDPEQGDSEEEDSEEDSEENSEEDSEEEDSEEEDQ
jgi:hypothetical protein